MNKRIRIKDLKQHLFFRISMVVCIAFTLVATCLYVVQYRYINRAAQISQTNFFTSVANSVDAEITGMNTLSANFVFSNLIKENFSEYKQTQKGAGSTSENAQRQQYNQLNTLYDFIIAIIGPSRINNQVNLYSPNGLWVGSGFTTSWGHVALKDMVWYEDVKKAHGRKVVSMPWYSAPMRENVISLVREFYSSNYEFEGMVEIQVPYSRFFMEVDTIHRQNPNTDIYITNQKGEAVYTSNNISEEELALYHTHIKEQTLQAGATHHINALRHETLYWGTLEGVGWEIILVQSNSSLYAPLYQFTVVALCIIIAALAVTILLSYSLAKKISLPIVQLSVQVSGIALNNTGNLSVIHKIPSDIRELAILYNGLAAMQQKLQKSLDELVRSKTEEANIKALALQQLMSPHFLYNNLAVLSALAGQGKTQEVEVFCADLSFMLRYASSGFEKKTTLRMETDFSQRYLACMQSKYAGEIRWRIEIPESLHDMEVPRMSLQPLLENAFKHGMLQSKNFVIAITGHNDTSCKKISVTDNGNGFDPEIRDLIKHQLATGERLSAGQGLHIGGMGIYNLYLRMKLLYGEATLLCIEDSPDGGTRITIGYYNCEGGAHDAG